MYSAKPIVPEMDMVFTISAAAVASETNFRAMKEIVKKIIKKFGTDRIQYSLVTFGDPPVVQLRFRDKYQEDGLIKLIDALPKPSGSYINTS